MAICFRTEPVFGSISRSVPFSGRWPYLAVFVHKMLPKTVNDRMAIFVAQAVWTGKKKKQNVTYGFPGNQSKSID